MGRARIIRPMLVNEIGEVQLIEALERVVSGQAAAPAKEGRDDEVRLSIGDDASAWEPPATTQVLTTDSLVEGVHFRLDRTSWRDLGWKAMAVNLSDVAAMGCTPLHSLVTLGLRGDLPVDGLVEMYGGMAEAYSLYGGAIVGGDVVRSATFFMSVTMNGAGLEGPDGPAGPAPLLKRSCARPGDVIGVTGSLGCSAGGLRTWSDSGSRPIADRTAAHLRDAHNRPIPRVGQGQGLVRAGVRAAMDVSDGLVHDLGKLCAASGVGAVVHAEQAPADAFLREAYPEEWLDLALTGGEDYELLFTAPRRVMAAAAAALDVPVTVIGEIVEGEPGVTVLGADGRPRPMGAGGWEHFRQDAAG